MKTTVIHKKILEAREIRALSRLEIASRGYNSLSLSLNIAGYPKSSPQIHLFFNEIIKELALFLLANRIKTHENNKILTKDEAGDFYLIPLSSENKSVKEIKNITEDFEENHALGRLIDIDIFSSSGESISSGKKKECYFCGKYSAISCMRNKRHTYKEIRQKFLTDIQNYQKEKQKQKWVKTLSSAALKAVLYEVSLSPKPGLVDYFDSGSHKDMNFYSFINSSAILSPYFKEFCLIGYKFTGDYNKALPKIREIGLSAEKAMFEATGGVNTQKGIIFLFGIALFSAAKEFSETNTFTEKGFRRIVKEISKNIVENELKINKKAHTNGEKVYSKYGKTGEGIRREVASGFETIFRSAIPYLSKNLSPNKIKGQKELTLILQEALLRIMVINNDSNILYRSGLETLDELKSLSKKVLEGLQKYESLSYFCSKKNISPGGSADLLAVSLLIYFLKLL